MGAAYLTRLGFGPNRRAIELREERRAVNASALRVAERAIRRDDALARFDEILADPATPSGVREFALSQRAYLLAYPERGPSDGVQTALRRIVFARHMRDLGRGKPSTNPRKRAVRRQYAERPAWMKDATLLPKKPPVRLGDSSESSPSAEALTGRCDVE